MRKIILFAVISLISVGQAAPATQPSAPEGMVAVTVPIVYPHDTLEQQISELRQVNDILRNTILQQSQQIAALKSQLSKAPKAVLPPVAKDDFALKVGMTMQDVALLKGLVPEKTAESNGRETWEIFDYSTDYQYDVIVRDGKIASVYRHLSIYHKEPGVVTPGGYLIK